MNFTTSLLGRRHEIVQVDKKGVYEVFEGIDKDNASCRYILTHFDKKNLVFRGSPLFVYILYILI